MKKIFFKINNFVANLALNTQRFSIRPRGGAKTVQLFRQWQSHSFGERRRTGSVFLGLVLQK
ncbi:MAG TPA: hypothetical protein ENI57_00065 [Ignavibacteria bacterium]|nr:hypothetical protein [Ignavibacteria bacterium]